MGIDPSNSKDHNSGANVLFKQNYTSNKMNRPKMAQDD